MATVKSTLLDAREFIIAAAKQMADSGKPAEGVMLHSSPGVGKSAVVNGLGGEIGDLFEQTFNAKFKVWDVRVGSMQESDIQGIPYPTTVGVADDGREIKDMQFSTPMWFPKEGECGILFLDELSNAPIANQHACYRLVHDRTIHNGTKLPAGVMIAAAGNTKEDKTGAKGIVPALARRFQAHFFIEPTVEEFNIYAFRNGLHSSVIAFLSYDPSKLVGHSLAGEYGFPCPANWESVSNILQNKYLSDSLREAGVLSCVGTSVGTEFIGFLRNADYLPNFEKVRRTGEYELPKNADVDRGIAFTIISATAAQLLQDLTSPVALTAEQKAGADNLANILTKFDVSTMGVTFRSVKRANPQALAKIIGDKAYPKLATALKDVVTRASSMT